jgi:recombination protein RecA
MASHPPANPAVFSTGSLKLDLALPLGGVPGGDVMLIHGPPDCGKTVLCLSMLARNCGKPDGMPGGNPGVIIDADGTLEPGFAVRCRLDPELVYICKPTCPADALDIAETLINSGAWPLVIVDSASALVDRGEDGQDSAGENKFAVYLPRLERTARQKGCLLVFTERPDPQATAIYHELKNHLPRLALPLRADWRFSLAPITERSGGYPTRLSVQVQVNKSGRRLISTAPNLTIQINLMYNQGIARSGEILELGLNYSIIQRQGAEYYFRGLLMGTGLEEASGFLSTHPDLADLIEQDIRRFYRAAT